MCASCTGSNDKILDDLLYQEIYAGKKKKIGIEALFFEQLFAR